MIGVAEVKYLSGAGFNARGLHAHFGAVRAKIAFVRDVVVVVPPSTHAVGTVTDVSRNSPAEANSPFGPHGATAVARAT